MRNDAFTIDMQKIREWITSPLFLFFLLTLALYGQSFSFSPFIFDDYFLIFENPHIFGKRLEDFTYFLFNSKTPIPYLIWKLIGYVSPAYSTLPFHLLSTILHTLNGFLLFRISSYLFKILELEDEDIRITSLSYCVALLYLIHPANVEAVVWVSNAKNLMGTFFVLAALLFLLKSSTKSEGEFRLKDYIPSGLLFLLSFLSHPASIVGVFLIPFVMAFIPNRNTKILKTTFIFSLILIVTIALIHFGDTRTLYFSKVDLLTRIQIISTSFFFYFTKSLLPIAPIFDYQINPFVISFLNETNQFSAFYYFGFIFVILSLFFLTKPRLKYYGIFLTSFLFLATPYCGLILHDFNNISVVADRYFNLSLTAFCFALTLGLREASQFSKERFHSLPSYSILAFTLILFSLTTSWQISRWNDHESILRSSTGLSEIRPSTLIALANHYKNRGQYNEARLLFKEAISQDPNSASAFVGLLKLNEISPSLTEDLFLLKYLENHHLDRTLTMFDPLVKLYLRKGKFDLAKKELKKMAGTGYLTKEAADLEVIYEAKRKEVVETSLSTLEIYFLETNKREKALQMVKELLHLNPNNSNLREKIGRYLDGVPQ